MMLKKILRTILKIRENETIADGIRRYYYHFEKKLPYKKISKKELSLLLDNIGIKKGDVLIVHASWRAMYMLETSPKDVIELLLDKIDKKEGTLLMPAYGKDDNFFDLNKTKSVAGVLSETLRNYPGTKRSCFPKFSMCGYGKYANEILNKHKNSIYQFDENSPYSIATKQYNAKILLMGMGKKPHKISVFHCASYALKNTITYYKKCYSNPKTAYIISDKKINKIFYLDRMPEYKNNKYIFKKLFTKIPNKHIISKKRLNLISFNAIDAYDVALKFCKNGRKLYTK